MCALTLLIAAGCAYANPFFGGTPGRPAPAPEVGTQPSNRRVGDLQWRLSETLADFIASARGSPLAAVLVAVAYGFVHALGPGHRKTVILTYFGTQKATIAQALLVGLGVAAMHFAATISVTYGAYYVVQATVTASSMATISVLTGSSYAFVTIAGAVLLYLALRDWIRGHAAGDRPSNEAHRHTDEGGRPSNDGGRPRGKRGRPRRPAAVIASALAPCPGASMVAILSLSMGRPGFGVAAVLAMSVGTAGVTAPIAALAAAGRTGVVTWVPRHQRVSEILHHGLETAGGVILLAFGIVMLYPYIIVWAAG